MHRAIILSLFVFAALCRAADYQVEGNIRYSHFPENVLDILQSRAPALQNRPGVVLIHGDGLVQGQKESMVEQFAVPFIQHGFVVANVEYRLAEAASAEGVRDVLTAVDWFHDHAGQYKVDTRRIIVLGASAGGRLGLQAASFGPAASVAAVIDFFGVVESPDPLLSPLAHVRKGLPPVLAIHGDADPTVPYDQSVRLIQALKSAGDDAELITVPGGKHGFTPAEMDKLWPQIFKWLKKRRISS
ncbi:MAG: alpha/beta hydrolase [Acidobacteriia bacterium]|nr:alpha/beta hydrolase [Terriglobia bacterium]